MHYLPVQCLRASTLLGPGRDKTWSLLCTAPVRPGEVSHCHNTVQRVLHVGALRAKTEHWCEAVKLKVVSEWNIQGHFWNLKVDSGEPCWRALEQQEQPGPEAWARRCVKGTPRASSALETWGKTGAQPSRCAGAKWQRPLILGCGSLASVSGSEIPTKDFKENYDTGSGPQWGQWIGKQKNECGPGKAFRSCPQSLLHFRISRRQSL